MLSNYSIENISFLINKFDQSLSYPLLQKEERLLPLYNKKSGFEHKIQYDPTLEYKYLQEILKFTLFHRTYEPKEEFQYPTNADAYLKEINKQCTIKEKQQFLKTLKKIIESTIYSSFLALDEKEKIFKNLKVINTKKDYLKIIGICSCVLFITFTPICIVLAENKKLTAIACITLAALPYMLGMYFLDNNFAFPKHRDVIYNRNSYMAWLDEWNSVINEIQPITYEYGINHADVIQMVQNNNINTNISSILKKTSIPKL